MRALVLGVAAALAVAAPGVANAASQGWAVQPVPLPAGSAGGTLTTVSCLSADDCLAGGYQSIGNYPRQLLGEQWDGSSWQVLQFTLPPQEAEAWVTQVLCVTTSNCFMVGIYVSEKGKRQEMPLAEHWDGSTWTIQAIPDTDATGTLTGISCPAADDCTAVGSTLSADGRDTAPLAVRWDGSSWTQQAVPRPTGTIADHDKDSSLASVSCVSAANCTAVGHIGIEETQSVAEHWNGSHWVIQPVPAPAGATYSLLNGVSCPKASFCLATGYSYNDADLYPSTAITEAWSGHGWTQQTLPLPSGTLTSALNGLSCASATRCTAVGSLINSRGTGTETNALAEFWTGSSWAVQRTAQPQAREDLQAISCPAPRVCSAVGANTDFTPPPVAENENQ
jgi:hypothetical protein